MKFSKAGGNVSALGLSHAAKRNRNGNDHLEARPENKPVQGRDRGVTLYGFPVHKMPHTRHNGHKLAGNP